MARPPAAPRASLLATVRDKHAQGNRRAKDDWELYRDHRAHLTAAIAALARAAPDAPLVLLGAGNCNDVDVAGLAPRFSAVHLVDIDGGALDRARARLTPEQRAHCHPRRGRVDRAARRSPQGAAFHQRHPLAAGVALIKSAVGVSDAEAGP